MKKLIQLLFFLCCINTAIFSQVKKVESFGGATSFNKTVFSVQYTLHKQIRLFDFVISEKADTICIDWSIFRDSKRLNGCYKVPYQALKCGNMLSWDQPETDKVIYLSSMETFGFISRDALRKLCEEGSFVYNQTTYRKINQDEMFVSQQTADIPSKYKDKSLIHVRADIDRTEMWIVNDPKLPFIYRMSNNPIGIDWIIY